MKRWIAFIGFLVFVVGGGLVIGFLTVPGEWYAQLNKPAFNPPNWIFAPVWTVLYVMIAMAGWRTFERNRSDWSMRSWWLQLGLNFLWSPVFFTAHQIGAALLIILLLFVAVIGFIVMSLRQDRVAAWLFAPYAVWVMFASMLNGAIWLLN
jgi:tryptophan-rich sensory protein